MRYNRNTAAAMRAEIRKLKGQLRAARRANGRLRISFALRMAVDLLRDPRPPMPSLVRNVPLTKEERDADDAQLAKRPDWITQR